MDLQESEDRIQADCWQWLYGTYPRTRGLCFHIRNGGSLNSGREGNKFKAMGVVPGIPDLCLAIPASFKKENKTIGGTHIQYGSWNALYIEMKAGNGKESPEQLRIHSILRAAGNRVETIYTLEAFKELIHEYLKDSEYLVRGTLV